MTPTRSKPNITLPGWSRGLLERPERYLVIYGSRGSQKSWSVAINIVLKCAQTPHYRVAVLREFAATLDDSAIKLLWDLCRRFGVKATKSPRSTRILFTETGSEIIAKGAERNPDNLRGLEGFNLAWCEEAHALSQASIDLLDPSIRHPGSKLIFTFNPEWEDDPVYATFVASPPSNTWVKKVVYGQHPEFNTPELDQARARMKEQNHPLFAHHWLGALKTLVGAFFDASQVVAESVWQPAKGIYRIRAWDTAGTQDGGDYTVGVLLAAERVGNRWSAFQIQDVVRGQWESSQVEKMVLQTAARDGTGVGIAIEHGPSDAGKRDARRWTQALAGYSLRMVPPAGKKSDRARPVASSLNGRLFSRVAGAPWWTAMARELSQFSEDQTEMKGRHDDQVDALSLAFGQMTRRRQEQYISRSEVA